MEAVGILHILQLKICPSYHPDSRTAACPLLPAASVEYEDRTHSVLCPSGTAPRGNCDLLLILPAHVTKGSEAARGVTVLETVEKVDAEHSVAVPDFELGNGPLFVFLHQVGVRVHD